MASPRIVKPRRQNVEIRMGKLLTRAQSEAGAVFRKPTAHPKRDPQLYALETLEAAADVFAQLLDKLADTRKPAPAPTQRRIA